MQSTSIPWGIIVIAAIPVKFLFRCLLLKEFVSVDEHVREAFFIHRKTNINTELLIIYACKCKFVYLGLISTFPQISINTQKLKKIIIQSLKFKKFFLFANSFVFIFEIGNWTKVIWLMVMSNVDEIRDLVVEVSLHACLAPAENKANRLEMDNYNYPELNF